MISLRYLDQLMSMLLSMYKMPGCPMFTNIRLSNSCINTKFVDISRLPECDDIVFEAAISLKELDRTVQILQVCFLLVDEFAETIDKCHSKHRITAVDMLFNWFKTFTDSPGNFPYSNLDEVFNRFIMVKFRPKIRHLLC